MKIKIGILNSKGGCGKTTIAINLSVAISHQMIKTVLIDADPNQGALFWFKKRNKNHLSNYLKVTSLNKLKKIKNFECLIYDCPANMKDKKVKDIISQCNYLIIPIQASIFDQTATNLFFELVNKLSRIRKGKTDLVFVINRYKKRARIFKKLNAFLLSKKIKPLCRFSDRMAYQLLVAEGKSIFDVNHKPIYDLKNEWVPLLHFLRVK